MKTKEEPELDKVLDEILKPVSCDGYDYAEIKTKLKALIREQVLEGVAEYKISPACSIAMTVAKAQLERGENPTENITATLLIELERLKALRERKN